jgi:ankyrin repeat protein
VHTMQIAGQLPQSRIVGPLAVNSYFQCSLTHVAAYKVDSASLQFLQDNNVLGDIDSRSQEGATPLHFAVCCWSTSTTRWLLENGADVNAKCGTRDISALHVALRWGHLENAIALIEAGATFSADSAGITPEMQMHPSIRADLLNTLPHVGVPIPTAVMEAIRRDHQRASFGSLYKAIIDGDLKSCSSIIAGTPDWDSPLDECGSCTPLIVALSHGRLEIARLFLSHGASTNGRPCSRSPELYHIRARSVIEIAIQRPVFNGILEEILEASLSYEAHWSQALDCWRPLHLAAAMNVAGIKIFVNHIIKHFALLRYAHFFSRIMLHQARNVRMLHVKKLSILLK